MPKPVKQAVDVMHEDKYEFKITVKSVELISNKKELLIELLNKTMKSLQLLVTMKTL